LKRNKFYIRIRTKLIAVFTLFTMLALLTLMAFQGVLLEPIYRQIKINGIKSAVSDIKQCVEQGSAVLPAEYWEAAEGMAVYVFDESGHLHYSDRSIGPFVSLPEAERQRIYQDAVAADGVYFNQKEAEFFRNSPKEFDNMAQKPMGDKEPKKHDSFGDRSMPDKRVDSIVLYGEITTSSEGDELLVVAVSNISPVDATVRTLNVQSVTAALVIVVMAVVLSLIVARKIASPIVNINKAAKGLSDGTYCSPPRKGDYLEAVQLQETLDQVALDLQKNQMLQRELIANVSHDLRTPLTMITGYSEAIRDLPSDDHSDSIQVVIDEANRLNRLVNDLLDLSKLKSGVQVLEKAPIEFTDFLEEIVERLGRMAAAHDIRIQFEYDTAVTVNADSMRLSQAVYNLISNAMYYVGEDRTVYVQQCTTEHTVRVLFTDHGKGIAKDQLDSIWERYYRVRTAGEERPCMDTHSGLGLAIVKSVIELHDGRCGAESEEGKGSTFWFEIPRI